MSQPEDGPATVDQMKGRLKIALDDATDDVDLEDIEAAVNSVVRGLPVAQVDAAAWPARVTLGANMLGARLFRRRNSPTGVETFGADGPAYVSRNDPDVAQLLQIGAYTKPAVG